MRQATRCHKPSYHYVVKAGQQTNHPAPAQVCGMSQQFDVGEEKGTNCKRWTD